jgi:hypothetical protein
MESGALENHITCIQKAPRRKLRRVIAALCICFLLLSAVSKTYAQNGTDYAVHANIIYHFTKYINWPDEMKSGDFVIGIIGESPLFDKLKTFIANKTVSGQKIVIRKYSSSAQSFNCHILFISDDESGSLKQIASGTAASSILIVTETEGLARKGACINFVIVDERLKLEINKKNIQQRELGIATELLNLGTVVK